MFHISESRSLHNTSHVFQCDFQWLYFSSIAYHNEWASDLFTGYHCIFLHHVMKECDGIACSRGIGDGFIVFWRKFSTIDIFGIHSRWEKRKHHDVIISSLKIPEMFRFNAQDQMCKDKVPCCVFWCMWKQEWNMGRSITFLMMRFNTWSRAGHIQLWIKSLLCHCHKLRILMRLDGSCVRSRDRPMHVLFPECSWR